MATFIASAYQSVHDNVFTPVGDTGKAVYNAVQDTGLNMGHQFKVKTEEYLPMPLAILAQKLFSSIPIAASYFFLPLPIRLGLWSAYTVITICSGLKNSVIDESLGIAMGIEIIKAIASYTGTKDAIDIASAVLSIVGAAFYLNRSRN